MLRFQAVFADGLCAMTFCAVMRAVIFWRKYEVY
jgi:hypothetical protein